MTLYVPTLTVDNVIEALADFIEPFALGVPIVRAQVNRVPLPTPAAIQLTEILQVDLSTPRDLWQGADNIVQLTTPTRIDIQIDFYGPSAGEQCKAVKGVYRSIYATAQFPAGIQPLYCDDGRQSPLITGEHQYESRWTLTASMQYNAAVSVPQQFADEAVVTTTTAADLT